MRLLFSTAAAASLAWTAAVLPPTAYSIDPDASTVRIHVGKTGLFSFAGHTHEVAAPVADGRIELDHDDPARTSVRVVFDASALRVTGKGEPEEDVPEVQRTMESERVLGVSKFPRITFESRGVKILERDGDRLRARVTGDLTLHGVTRPETADVTVTMAGDRLTAKGTLTVRQTNYGIEPVTAGAGTVRVKDEVEIAFTLVAAAG